MRKPLIIKAPVALPAISVDGATGLYMLFYKSLKRCAPHIGDGDRSDRSIALNDADNGCLASSASSAFAFPLAAKVGFIDLDMTGQLVGQGIALNGLSDLGKHLPGDLVRYADFILQLIGRNTNLEETNGADPFGNRRPGLIKDRTRGFCKRIFTASTLVFKAVSLSEFPDSLMSTCGTSYPSRSTIFMNKIAAFTLVREIVSIIVKTHRGLLHLDSSFPSIQLVPLRG